jgi:uncharacterized protein YcfL
MKKQLILIICLILLLTTFLNGCQETESIKTNDEQKIFFESSVVELKESDIIFHKDDDKIVRVEVNYLFRNLLNEQVELEITVEFYDKNDNLLHTGGPKYIELIPLWSEVTILPANSIDYKDDENVEFVDYVVIVAERIN